MKIITDLPIVSEEGKNSYVDTASALGTMIMVLPYRRRRGHRQYLVENKWMPNWDSQMDTCGIAVYVEDEPVESLLVEMLTHVTGLTLEQEAFRYLGVCHADRFTNTSCQFYAVDLTLHADEAIFFDESKVSVEWVKAEDIIKSVDAYLHAAYASLQYIFQE